MTRIRLNDVLLVVAPIFLALFFTTVILLAVGASPWDAYRNILAGAFESPEKIADVVAACVPLVLCGVGMCITFTAGQWNVGVEGQIILGALFATWVARNLLWPQAPVLTLMLLAGMLGGALWGVIAALLKIYGNVHEIFGGLGLNYVAQGLAIWLIFNPWRPADGATMSGTDPFPDPAWMPRLAHLRVSPLAVILALLAVVVVYFLLRGTRWGLELRAMGKNFRSAYLLGVPSTPRLLTAFAACGALAGLAGAIRCSARYGRMIPDIAGGQGYLSLLVALLAVSRPQWVPFIAFFFAAVGVGSPRLELNMHLDSSLGGVLRASMVLAVMMVAGLRMLLNQRRARAAGETPSQDVVESGDAAG
ncbi:MAG: ABC transporter permease [Anaerolineae bacterium]|nr:ABC transporter permease [Anaerolineae bacterium]